MQSRSEAPAAQKSNFSSHDNEYQLQQSLDAATGSDDSALLGTILDG